MSHNNRTYVYELYDDVIIVIYPTEGRHGGVCNENAFSQGYTSFHATLHGEQDVGETVGCGWHQLSAILCRRVFGNDILDVITAKQISRT